VLLDNMLSSVRAVMADVAHVLLLIKMHDLGSHGWNTSKETWSQYQVRRGRREMELFTFTSHATEHWRWFAVLMMFSTLTSMYLA
jgi:hypothetical protein